MLGWTLGSIAAALGAGGGGLALFSHRTRRKVERALPPRGRFVDVSGHRLHVIEEGRGPPILLIHGLGGQIAHFHALMPELARDHRVIAVDRPGSGYSERPKGATAGPLAQADIMAALIDRLALERPLVVGHSLGGAVALALGLQHPEKVGGLALVCPVTREPGSIHPLFRPLIIRSDLARRVVGWTLAVPMSIRNGERNLAHAFAPEPPPANFRTEAGGLLGLRPHAFQNASMDIVALPHDLERMVPRYGDLRVPAAILYGRDDQLLDPDEQGRRTHGDAPLIGYDEIDGGHMIPITRAAEVADWVRKREHEWAAAPELHASPH